MKFLRFIGLVFLISNFFYCCKDKTKEDVTFDSNFLGARLDSVKKIGGDNYMAYINPAFEPVNKSPWYAFAISSTSNKEIQLTLNYGKYKHRYIPKVSLDKKSWKKIADSKIHLDTSSSLATLKLKVSTRKLYIAAQEIESSIDTYNWLDSLLSKNPFLIKEVAGKTVMKRNNYVVRSTGGANNSLVLIARQHPPEIPGGTVGFKAFFEELMAINSRAIAFRKAFTIIAFPVLNPDGIDAGNWRHNANGVDLNRDWIAFSQPETEMVKDYLAKEVEKGDSIRFAVDFHTSYSGPYLLVLDSINEKKSQKIIPSWVKNIESNSHLKVQTRRRSQVLPYCYNYFYNNLNSEAVTYEDGDEIDRVLIKEKAKIYAGELMKTLLLWHENKNQKTK